MPGVTQPPGQPSVPAPGVDCAKVKCVALTFDDGPGPYTNKLLGMLAKADARATFFMVGEMTGPRPGVMRRMVRDGHEVANHSWSHPNLARLSTAKVRRQLKRTQDSIARITGVRPTLMRPPYGATDKQVVKATKELGLAQIIWNVDTMDWRDRNSKVVSRRAIKKVRPGSIVLFHDIHRTTVNAIPKVLRELKKKGYHFVTVSELYGTRLTPGKKYYRR
ncbi:polysaccharide deacetylase family protein [Bailinhaonella thermotolerans]|uniref:Polysaccharide deacetylase family protein n=2 Tax=Bailinhaonella thermotolerans TaxID=1070861 RepID=A0A3A4AX21_9ACTN|nr:polysaccharide deacetylase family protein [Bailinhaonella thermotolerans]